MKKIYVDQPDENIYVDEPDENIYVDQPDENIYLDQPDSYANTCMQLRVLLFFNKVNKYRLIAFCPTTTTT
jgi:hypothetical protein